MVRGLGSFYGLEFKGGRGVAGPVWCLGALKRGGGGVRVQGLGAAGLGFAPLNHTPHYDNTGLPCQRKP